MEFETVSEGAEVVFVSSSLGLLASGRQSYRALMSLGKSYLNSLSLNLVRPM